MRKRVFPEAQRYGRSRLDTYLWNASGVYVLCNVGIYNIYIYIQGDLRKPDILKDKLI